MGCKRLVALRGDLPSGMASYGDFRYASELVEFIRHESNGAFHIEVACYPEMHPQANDAQADLRHFVTKVKAGADGAITQYFFNPDAYFRFVDDARRHGVDIPIVAGVMPISQYSQLRRFFGYVRRGDSALGRQAPGILSRRRRIDPQLRHRTVVADLVRRLIDGGAPGVHFYTLNRAKATLAVLDRLGL